ncbi:hypothetical protein [Streptomyces cyaneofuscatus]|uniref:hypothetical protein n=1 Tax=Streptomyces cyaneofuscatus TaxID=66883 RepID=UPI00381DA59F
MALPDTTTPEVRMPTNTDSTPHQHAAAMAYTWAQRAEDHHGQAANAQAEVTAHQNTSGGYSTRLLRQHEADLAHHTERTTDSIGMAQMWARVAIAQGHP